MKKTVLFLLLLFACPYAFGQASVSLSPVAKQQFFSATGLPLAGGKLYTYQAGTTTPQATYVDATGTAVNTNPIILDSGGFANIWLVNNEQYKFVLYDVNGVLQWSVDNFSVGGSGGGSGNCPGTVPANSVLFVHPLGTCDGVTKFTSTESGQVDINSGGTFEIDSVLQPANNFTFAQGHQVYVKSTSADYDGSTDDGFTAYVDDTQTPPTSGSSVVATNVSVSGGTLTITATGADSVWTNPGTYAAFSGFTNATFLNGQVVQIANAGATSLIAINTGFSDYGSAADTGTVTLQSSSNPIPFYSSGGVQYGGQYIGYYSDSQASGENPHAARTTDFLANAYGDGPDYGYAFDAQEHLFVHTESAQLLAESAGSGSNQHQYAVKVGNPGATPFFWVAQNGGLYSRSGYANVASVSVGSCTISPGLSDCTAGVYQTGLGPPASETITLTVCATGTQYDTFDWTLNGSFPSCSSPHMFAANAGSPITINDDIYVQFASATGHTLNATATIPVTVGLGTTLATQGGTYLSSTALPQPGNPAVTPNPAGATTWAYCVSETWNGVTTQCSSATSINNGPITLNGSNYNNVAVGSANSNPAIQCTVYRTVASGTPSTTGIISGPSHALCGTVLADTGLAGDSSSPPATNLTGHTVFADGYLETPSGTQFHLPGISGTGCIGISSGVVSTSASACSGTAGVSSVTVAGTTNQIAVSGTCTITSTGTCTVGFPSGGVTLPATTTGTFSGNLTGNVTGNVTGSANNILGSLVLANTPLTTNQDILFDSSGSLARLPISTVTSGQCLGNNSGTWSTFACSGGSGSGINITVNGGSALGGPANFQNGTSGNIINFSNPSGSIVQATIQSNAITSGFLASNLTLGGTTTATISGNATTATGLASVTGYSVYGSGASTGTWITPTGNGQCLMSAPSSYATTTPSFQSCASTSLFASYQFASNAAITSTGNYFQLVPGVGLTSSYSGSGSSGSPYIATLTLANPSASTLGGIQSFAAVTHNWIRQISTSGVVTASQPASTDLSDYGTIPNAALANASVTINGTAVALGASGNIPIQTNGSNNTSMAGLNMKPSTVNAVGLTVTPTNPGTNQETFEITGGTYTGTASKATQLASTPSQCSSPQLATGIAANGNANCTTNVVANSSTTVSAFTMAANSCYSGAGVLNTATSVSMSGVTTAASFVFTPTSDVSGITGWGATGGLVIRSWPTANNANYKVCNQTSSPIVLGGSVTLNIGVVQH